MDSWHNDDRRRSGLLSLLRENARASTADLARRLGVSRTTVQSRIERLEKRGVIAGYGVRLSPDYEQTLVRAHVLVTVAPKLAEQGRAPACARSPTCAPCIRSAAIST